MTKFYHSPFFPRRLFSENILKNFSLTILAVIIFIAGSCEEDPTNIGRRMLPGSDFVTIRSTDTISVKSFTMYRDSIESDNPSTLYLGQFTDPYFGSITTEFVSQIRLYQVWDDEAFVVDSVKLFLQLLTVKGAADKPQYLTLSEIAKEIYTDSTYYSSQNVPLTGFSITGIRLPDGLRADTINDLVIDIPKIFGEYITRDTSMLFHSSSKPDFRSYFKGLLFQIESPEDPVFVSLSVEPPGTYETYMNYFTIYMSDTNGNVKECNLMLDAKATNAAFNLYRHDFSTADPDKRILHINDGYRDTLSYAQMMNGLFTKLDIPSLSGIKNDPAMKGISVNRARIIVPVVFDNDIYKPSTIPSQVYLRYVTSSGRRYIVPDYSVSSAFYDGRPDTTNNVYNINISTWMQNYIENSSDTLTTQFELFLLPSSGNNVILKANNSHTPVKFEFIYTYF